MKNEDFPCFFFVFYMKNYSILNIFRFYPTKIAFSGVGLLCLLAALVIYFTVIRPASTIPPSVNSSNLPIFLDPRTQQPDLESSTETATLTTSGGLFLNSKKLF